MEAALKAFLLGSSTSTSSSNDNNNNNKSGNPLLSDRLLENKIQGAVVCDPGGPFQEFVLRVEDATILHLAECIGSLNLSGPASYFLTASSRLGSGDGYSATYSRSPIGQIRISIRIAARNNPVRLMEWIDSVISKISEKDDRIKPLGREALRGHAKSLANLKSQFLTYFPLDDEPLAEIIHINRSQFLNVNGDGTRNVAIEVNKCGSIQVRGQYAPVPGTELPCYCNMQGYIITRMKRTISSVTLEEKPIFLMPGQKLKVEKHEGGQGLQSEIDSNPFNDNADSKNDIQRNENNNSNEYVTEDEISLFIWYIANPALSSVYYYCPSIEPSPLPPAVGWQQTGLGKYPTPMLQVGTINFSSSNKHDSTENFRPLESIDFAPVQSLGNTLDYNQELLEYSKILDRIKLTRTSRQVERSIVEVANEIRDSVPNENLKSFLDQQEEEDEFDEYLDPSADRIRGDAVLNEIRQISETRLEDTNILKRFIDRCSSLEKKCLDEQKMALEKKFWLESCSADELLLGFPNSKSSTTDIVKSNIYNDMDNSKFDSIWSLDLILQNIRNNQREEDQEHQKQYPAPTDMLRRLRHGLFGSNSQSMSNINSMVSTEANPKSSSKTMFEAIGDIISSSHVENTPSKLNTSNKTHRKTLSSPSVLQTFNDYIPNISESGTDETQSIDRAHDEMTTRCLIDLIEMAVPDLRSQLLNAEVSVLGVEIWPPFKGSKAKNPDKLTYVLRVNLSDIRATSENNDRPLSTTPTMMTMVSETSSDNSGNEINEASATLVTSSESLATSAVAVESEVSFDSKLPISQSTPVGVRASLSSESLATDGVKAQNQDRSDENNYKNYMKGSSFESASSASFGSNIPHISGKTEKKSAFSSFAKEALHRFDGRMNIDGRHVFTVRRDLPTLCAFHAELTQLLEGTDIIPPPFPDPFTIGNLEEDVIRSLNMQTSNKKKMRIGQPFLYNEQMRHIMKSKECDIGDPKVMDGAMKSIQEYIQGVFALIELIEDHANDLKQDVYHSKNTSPAPLSSMQDSLDIESDRASPTTGLHSEQSSPSPSFSHVVNKNDNDTSINYLVSLPAKLGKLMGSFLQASDLEDVVMKRAREGDVRSPRTVSPFGLKSESREYLNLLSSSSSNTKFQHPCWYPYATSGLRLSLAVHDDFGGRLSVKSEEELLRIQRSKCIGCGEPLLSGFLGFDRNYLPCRYYGGLFCKRWCHSDDHRVIPHRILLYWDKTPHRVCRQAAIFLDYIWSKPLLKLKNINPLLYEGVPILRLTRSLRSRISILLDSMIDIDAEQVRDCLLAIIGPNRMHMCVSEELYSMTDIVNIQSGYLVKDLQDLIENLITIAPTAAYLAQHIDIDDNRTIEGLSQIAYLTQRFTC